MSRVSRSIVGPEPVRGIRLFRRWPTRAWCVALGWVAPWVAVANPGDHIRVGEAVVTPSIGAAVEHTTNAFHSDTDPQAGTRFRISPGIAVTSEGPDLDLSLQGAYDVRKYFQPELSNLDRFNDFNVTSSVRALKTGLIGLTGSESVGLRNYPADAEFSSRPFQTEFRNQLGGAVLVRPGSAFEARVGGFWNFQDVQIAAGAQASGLRRLNRANAIGPRGGLEWRFFPRTALVVDASYEMNRWAENVLDAVDAVSGELAIPNSAHLKVSTGLRGRVTEKISTVLLLGYGSGVYDDATVGGAADAPLTATGAGADVMGAQRLLVDAQVRFQPSNDDRVILGYERGFRDVFFTNFVAYNQVYLRGNSRFTPRVGASADVALRAEGYRGQVSRDDLYVQANADVSYFLRDWAAINGGALWVQRISDASGVNYGDLNVRVGAQFTY
jgi:hypothetical protein